MNRGSRGAVTSVISIIAGNWLSLWFLTLGWGFEEQRLRASGNLEGVAIGFLLTLAVAYLVAYFAVRPFGRYWWIGSLLVVGPSALMVVPLMISQLLHGARVLPDGLFYGAFVLVVFAGDFSGRRRTDREPPPTEVGGARQSTVASVQDVSQFQCREPLGASQQVSAPDLQPPARFRICGAGIGFGLIAVVITAPVWLLFGPYVVAFTPIPVSAFMVVAPAAILAFVIWKVCSGSKNAS